MPQEPLPLKCLQNILRFLSEEYDTDTMVRLLCVNKTFCTTTLPFLYGDCFNYWMHSRWPRSDKDPLTTTAQMVRTLVRQVAPRNQLPDILRIATLTQDDQNDLQSTAEIPPASAFKYIHFIRKIKPDWESFHSVLNFLRENSSVMDYATTHQLFNKFVEEGTLSNDIHEDSRKWALASAIKMEIHRQLIWTICQGRLETIEELCLPLIDIERYMDHVHQLSSLSEVRLSPDNIVWSSDFRYTSDPPEERNQRNKEQEELRDRFFKGMIQFVQQHTSIHKNVLRNVHVPYFHGTHQHSPVDVHFEILGLLPPLLNPRSISTSNWFQIVARLNDINLNFVESIDLITDLGDDRAEKISKLLSKQPPSFLSRCRTLRKLAMRTLGPDTFHWAVLEKKQREEAQKQESMMDQNLLHGYHHHSALVPLIPLVPIRSIEIINSKSLVMIQELSDIGFAFGDSLEELSVSDWWYSKGPQLTDLTTNTSQPIHGQGWDLPRLRLLRFGVNNYQLHFDMDALERCSALESLSLRDTTMALHYRDIRSWSPVRLPHLKKLDLKGSPAIRFNLESLRHSPSLEELSLQIEALDGHSHDKPSSEGLEGDDPPGTRQRTESYEASGESGTMVQGYPSIGRSPQFTWDWCLPKLSSLYLRAVFALEFDFNWLQQLSSLQRLHLDIGSSVERSVRERRIALGELSKCQQKRQHLDENRSGEVLSDLYFSLPKLESMTLEGRWIFEERVLEVFCLIVAPNLHGVDLGEGCSGYTLQKWIPLARKMPHVECMALGLPLTDDEIREAGLIPERELRDDQRNKKRIDYNVWQGRFFDLLES